eukprot:COSAG01_NODE_41472_length_451_cov_0.721591_2_plen_36_part_01
MGAMVRAAATAVVQMQTRAVAVGARVAVQEQPRATR